MSKLLCFPSPFCGWLWVVVRLIVVPPGPFDFQCFICMPYYNSLETSFLRLPFGRGAYVWVFLFPFSSPRQCQVLLMHGRRAFPHFPAPNPPGFYSRAAHSLFIFYFLLSAFFFVFYYTHVCFV